MLTTSRFRLGIAIGLVVAAPAFAGESSYRLSRVRMAANHADRSLGGE